MEPESSTASLSIPHVAMGFEQEDASRLGEISSTLLKAVAGFIKITDLDGVTFAVDYEAGLASVERGYDDDDPVSYTNNGFAIGAAMALPVKRGDAWKTHIVLGPTVCDLLLSDDEDKRLQGVKVFIHELAHVDDNSMMLRTFTEDDSRRLAADPKVKFLCEIAGPVRSEYFCSRLLAAIGETDHAAELELFLGTCETQLPILRAAKTDYRFDGDLDQFLLKAKAAIRDMFYAFVSLAGHCDGLGEEGGMEDALAAADIDDETRTSLRTLNAKLRDLWKRKGNWNGIEDLLALNDPVEAIFTANGMHLSASNNGLVYLDMPIHSSEQIYLIGLRALGRS